MPYEREGADPHITGFGSKEGDLKKALEGIEGMFLKVAFPNMPAIWGYCKPIIEVNARKKGKGNSWQGMQAADEFWNKKTREETRELEKADTVDDLLKELCDVIIISAFRAHNIIEGRVALKYSVACETCKTVIQARTKKKLNELVDNHSKANKGHDDFHTCAYDEETHRFVGP